MRSVPAEYTMHGLCDRAFSMAKLTFPAQAEVQKLKAERDAACSETQRCGMQSASGIAYPGALSCCRRHDGDIACRLRRELQAATSSHTSFVERVTDELDRRGAWRMQSLATRVRKTLHEAGSGESAAGGPVSLPLPAATQGFASTAVKQVCIRRCMLQCCITP
jgi:hypothetical protein